MVGRVGEEGTKRLQVGVLLMLLLLKVPTGPP